MPSRTALFQLLPWEGGLNSAVDESLISPGQLTVADNIVFDTRGSRKKREGINHNYDNVTAGSRTIIGLHDFWYGSTTRTQRQIRISSDRKAYNDNAGTVTELTVAGTAWSGTLTTCSMTTFNNLCIIAVSGSSNVVKKYSGSGDVEDLNGTPPTGSLLGQHLGRLWMNDKSNPDRLHYSPTHDHTQWNGAGDSGAIDIGVGDGDPEGITGFYSFRGVLFVWKKTKMYKVSGLVPEEFQVELVTSGVGCASHNSITSIDTEDLMWVSDKGVHALSTTANYGDFTSNYVSVDIQKTFNDDIDTSRLKYVWGAYLPNINSVAFTFTEESGLNRSLTTSSVNNAVYLYNIPRKSWYRWPDLPCSSLIVANDSDKKRFYLGTHTGRAIKTSNGTNYDVSATGTNTAISMRIQTGQLLLDGNPYSAKALKRFGLIYKPQGTHNLTVTLKIDNINIDAENSLSFSETASSALLGSTFTLGSSTLGYDVVLAAYTRTIDGFGKTVKVTIEQSDVDAPAEIQGFFIEYEGGGTVPEVFLRS